MKLINERMSIAIDDGIADVRLARPDRMNALDGAMFAGIEQALAELAYSGARVVVLSGEGRAFCAGLDRGMFGQMAGGAVQSLPSDLSARTHGTSNLPQHVVTGWRHLPMPVIAAVHGVALGGGFQLALGADIRIVHPATRLALMEVKWGLIPDMGGMALLPRLVRDGDLRDLMFTAREFDGAEAKALGIATRLADDPLDAAMAMAREMVGHSPSAMLAAKRLANQAYQVDEATILLAEAAEQQPLIGGADQREAIAARLEGRTPSFGV